MKKIYLILLVLPLLLNSCLFNDDDKFTESASERMSKTIDNIRPVLEGAQNGWVMGIYPNKTQEFGGYTLFMKFSDGNKLVVASELDKPDKTIESMYDLISDNGPTLSFNVYNEFIHFFSEPMNPEGLGPKDSGMGGDYEFMVLEATPQKIKLMGKKTRNIIYMTPLPDRNWTEMMTEYQKTMENYTPFINFTYTVNGITAQVKKGNYRQLKFTYAGKDNAVEEVTMGIRYTPIGYEFYEPLTIGGTEVSFMNYAPEGDTDTFVDAAGSGAKLTVVYPPLNEVLVQNNWYFSASKLSQTVLPQWKAVEVSLANIQEKLYRAFLGKQLSGYGFSFQSYDGTALWSGVMQYTYTLIGENQVKFTCTMVGLGEWDFYNANAGMKRMVQFLGYGSGIEKTFTLISDNDKAPTLIKLTDNSNPDSYVTLLKAIKNWPFEN